jgi:hypothetical protein
MLDLGNMTALAVRQPFAWLIIAGWKDIENRDWRPANPGLRFRGRCLIHASKLHDGLPDDWDWPDIKPPEEFLYGGIIGSVEIVDVVTESPSRWFVGHYGLVLRDPRPLPFMRCRGQLGFFKPELAA